MEYRRVDELWFEDGNLVLEIHARIFKVYAGFLEKHSTYFRDLEPGNNDEMYEGVRMVHLSSEWNYADIKNVLMVLFYPK